MLPTFQKPVRWHLGSLPNRDELLPLLTLEAAEFEAVLGQPVFFGGGRETQTDVWDVVVDPATDYAVLESDVIARRLTLTIPDPTAFLDGVHLLHTLAYSTETSVSDTEAPTYAAAFDRIRDEIVHVYPSMELRGLDWEAITERYGHVRKLDGPEFWEHAARWVAELGDAHTQLIPEQPRFHPPYIAAMDDQGATLLRVPEDSDAWTETLRQRPSVVATGDTVTISTITPNLEDLLREALANADPGQPLTIDLRGNSGGNLAAAAAARRLLVRDDGPFGTIAFTTGRGTLAEPAPLTTTVHPDAWSGDIRVLIDSMTYSAAEDFLHPLVGTSHVTIVGAPTGGGSGRPHTRLIKDSVRLATSTAITYTRDGAPIEYRGIQPGPSRDGARG